VSLRIAVVADTLVGWVGGGVVAGRRFVEALRLEHQVVVIGAKVGGPDHVELKGFQLPFRAMREMQFTMARPNRRILRETFSEVDVVHLQFPFWLSFVALEEARRAGLPIVAAFHVQPENALFNVGLRSRTLSRWMYRAWVHRFYNRADAVVCPSGFAQRKLVEHGLVVPTHVVSNGTSPDLVRRTPRKKPDGVGPITVLAVGRLSAEKRGDVLIDAVARSRHRHRIKLVLAGAGPLEAKLRARGRKLPLGVEIGYVERPRLEELFHVADLFVHGSEVELEGIAVLEAMRMGLPVLVAASSESAASELAVDDRFTFPCGDADALANRLDALLDRPGLLEEGARRASELAGTFDFRRSVGRLSDIYRSLWASKMRGAEHGRLGDREGRRFRFAGDQQIAEQERIGGDQVSGKSEEQRRSRG
jgi:glycosyltransferase involved in cell wall biosynthesis